ncbi:MAG: AEC family transporter [Candidatus Aminicenantes bacterium]|nr:AEC family transporter [Candidatus Aminicenantes bacterium]
MLTDILPLMLRLVLPMALGLLSRQLRLLPENGAEVLRIFVVRICMPFLVFQNLFSARVDSLPQFFPAAAAFVLLSLLYALTGAWVARLFFNGVKERNAYFIAVFMGNYGFLGWGVMHSFYGPDAFTRSVFFSMIFWPTFLLAGFFFLLRMNHRSSGSSASMGRMILVNATAPLAGAVLGVVANLGGLSLPEPLAELVHSFAAMSIPLILFTVGLGLTLNMKTGHWKTIAMAAVHRLLFGFLLGWIVWRLVAFFLPVDGLTGRVILMEAVMPTAAMSPFFTLYFDSDRELVDGVIAVTTLLSMVTLVLWYSVVEWIV